VGQFRRSWSRTHCEWGDGVALWPHRCPTRVVGTRRPCNSRHFDRHLPADWLIVPFFVELAAKVT
jgi:hypothetical protein